MQINLPFNVGDIVYFNEDTTIYETCKDCNNTKEIEIKSKIDETVEHIRCPFCHSRVIPITQVATAEIKYVSMIVGDTSFGDLPQEISIAALPESSSFIIRFKIDLSNRLKNDSLNLTWEDIKWKDKNMICYKTKEEAENAQK